MQRFHMSNFIKPPLISNLTNTEYYLKSKTLAERQRESSNIRDKYPDRVPVICKKTPHSNLCVLEKTKYLIPLDLTASQFMYIIRKRLKLKSEQALFLFVNNTIPSSTKTMADLYEEHVDDDGFLYISYTEENVFG